MKRCANQSTKISAHFIQLLMAIGVSLAFSSFALSMEKASTQDSKLTERPSCQITAEGPVEKRWNTVRIQIEGTIVAGAETLSDLSQKLRRLIVENRCSPSPVPCTFATEGLAMGAWVKHRILVQDIIAFGGDTTGRLFDQLAELKDVGICQ